MGVSRACWDNEASSLKIWPVVLVGTHAAKQECVRSLESLIGKESSVVAVSESTSSVGSSGSPDGGRMVGR